MKDEKITITIHCSQEQHYDQDVEVTPEELKLLKECDGWSVTKRTQPEQYNLIESLIDFNDVVWSTEQFETFEITED